MLLEYSRVVSSRGIPAACIARASMQCEYALVAGSVASATCMWTCQECQPAHLYLLLVIGQDFLCHRKYADTVHAWAARFAMPDYACSSHIPLVLHGQVPSDYRP